MALTRKHRGKLLSTVTSLMVAVVMVVGLQAPMAAFAADGWESSLTVEPQTEDVTIEYGTDTTVSVTITSNLNERVAISSQGNGVSCPTSYVDLVANTPQAVPITINPNKNLGVGQHTLTVLFMPQENRAARTFECHLTVEKAKVTLTSGANVSLYYGQKVNSKTTYVGTNKGSMTIAELGLRCDNLLDTVLPTGTHNGELSGASSNTYEVTGTAPLTVTVSKATPRLTGVKGSNLTAGSLLRSSTISGTATNPYTNEPVAGAWSWMSPDEKVGVSSGLTQTNSYDVKFTPDDRANYNEKYDIAAVVVMSSSGPSGGDSGNAADPSLRVTGGTWTYDRKQHGPTVTKEGVGSVSVVYTNQLTGETTTNPPVNAGQYKAKITLSPTVQYKGAEAEATITIKQRLVNLKTTGDAIQSRPYNGDNKATVDKNKILLDNYFPEDDVRLVIDNVTATYGSANVGDYVVLIQCPGATLAGSAADNYTLNNTTVSEKSTIFKRPASVDFKGGVMEKEYGETFTFGAQGSGYTIETGTADTKSGVLPNDLRSISLTSAGAASTATVGTYSVTALGAGANYDLKVNGSGTLKVNKTTPHLMSASAGSGKIGSPLSSVPVPTVTYVNKHNGEAVPGTVTWDDPNQTIGTTRTSYSYTFTPRYQANYTSVSGTVDVAATAKTPVDIKPNNTAFTYDGQPHGVSVSTSTQGATITTTYTIDGRETTTQPVDVGAYQYRIVADLPESAAYADNEITGTMTISPLTPTGQPKVSGDGPTLASYKLDGSTIAGVGGKAVKGTLRWDNPDAAVKAGDKYAWTFTSEDKNYSNASGTIIPKALSTAEVVDISKLQSAVTSAQTVFASAQVSANGYEVEPTKQWVTGAVNDVLKGAIAAANSCLTEGGATQKMVNDALASLTTAVNSFKASMQPGLKGTDNGAVVKKASTVTGAKNRYDLEPGGEGLTLTIGGEGDGAIFAYSECDAVASVVVNGNTVTVTAITQGTAVVTIGRAATDTYDQTSMNVGIIVGEAPADYVPPTDEAVDATPSVTPVAAAPTVRVYNPNGGKHLLVPEGEANELVAFGWEREPGAFITAETSNTPVYRLYNPYTTEHHYTTSQNEFNTLIGYGWQADNYGKPVFYSDDAKTVAVHRLYNPWADGASAHHYTSDDNEFATLCGNGWIDEGIGWHYVRIDA